MPNALLEAMASGRAIVATRTGGIPELVEDGRSGLVCPLGDPRSLARALSRALAEPGLRRELGEAARRRCAESFSVARMVEATQACYDAVSP